MAPVVVLLAELLLPHCCAHRPDGVFSPEEGQLCPCGSFSGPVLCPSVTGARGLAAFAPESTCECSPQPLSRAVALAEMGGPAGHGFRSSYSPCTLDRRRLGRHHGPKYCTCSEVYPSHSAASGESVVYLFYVHLYLQIHVASTYLDAASLLGLLRNNQESQLVVLELSL